MSSKSQRDHNACASSSCFHFPSPSIFPKTKIAPLLLKPYKGLSRLVTLPRRHRPAPVRFREREKSGPGKSRCSFCWTRAPSSSSIGRSFHRLSLSLCRSSRQGEGLDKLGELPSMSDPEHVRAPFPSPITPAYLKYLRLRQMRRRDPTGSFDEVDEACRSFEKYVVALIVEEGKVRDLTDVEEFLCGWSSLKSPVFLDLVCSFYGELCNDLFSESVLDDLINDDDEALII